MTKLKEGYMSKKEPDAYFAKMADPEYIKNRNESMDRATEFMDLCTKGIGWIVDIHNFCEEHNITPSDLIINYSQSKNC